MSKEFGLQWRNIDAKRVQYLMAIQGYIAEKADMDRRLKPSNKNTHGR